MESVRILCDFDAYPGGTKRSFRTGETYSGPDAELYVAKGLAEPVDSQADSSPASED